METTYFSPLYVKNEVEHDGLEHAVGSYAKTYIIRSGPDRFVPFECEVVRINEYDIPAMVKFVNEHKTLANIVIDDDTPILIMALMDIMLDNFYIYHMASKRCLTVFEYASKKFEILSYELNMYQIRQLMKAYVLLTICFRNNNIQWNIKTLINIIIDTNYELFYVVIKKYCEKMSGRSLFTTNSALNKQLVEYINDYFNNANKFEKPFKIFPIEQVTTNDVYNAIIYLSGI